MCIFFPVIIRLSEEKPPPELSKVCFYAPQTSRFVRPSRHTLFALSIESKSTEYISMKLEIYIHIN